MPSISWTKIYAGHITRKSKFFIKTLSCRSNQRKYLILSWHFYFQNYLPKILSTIITIIGDEIISRLDYKYSTNCLFLNNSLIIPLSNKLGTQNYLWPNFQNPYPQVRRILSVLNERH